MQSTVYQEPVSELSNETQNIHRAIVSLMEELEAVDFYNVSIPQIISPQISCSSNVRFWHKADIQSGAI